MPQYNSPFYNSWMGNSGQPPSFNTPESQTDWASQYLQGGNSSVPYSPPYMQGGNPGLDLTQPPDSLNPDQWKSPEETAGDRYYRNYGREGWENMTNQGALLPYQMEYQRKFGPEWQNIQRDYARGNLPGYTNDFSDATRGAQTGIGGAQTGKRISDSGDLTRLGGDYKAGIDALNPGGAKVADKYVSDLTSGAPTIGGISDPLLEQANQQASGAGKTSLQLQQEGIAGSELSKGGQLSTGEVSDLVQQVRGRGEARGLGDSNRTFANELLNLDSAQTQRQAQRMAQAQSTDAAGFNQTQGNRDFMLGTIRRNRGLTGQQQSGDKFNAGMDMQNRGMMGDAMSQFTNAYTNPGMNMHMDRTQAPAYGAHNVDQNWNQSQMPEMVKPWDAYGQDLSNTNANAANNSIINGQNQSYAQRAGWMDILSQSAPVLWDAYKKFTDQGGGGSPAPGGQPPTAAPAPPTPPGGIPQVYNPDVIGNVINPLFGGGDGNFTQPPGYGGLNTFSNWATPNSWSDPWKYAFQDPGGVGDEAYGNPLGLPQSQPGDIIGALPPSQGPIFPSGKTWEQNW